MTAAAAASESAREGKVARETAFTRTGLATAVTAASLVSCLTAWRSRDVFLGRIRPPSGTASDREASRWRHPHLTLLRSRRYPLAGPIPSFCLVTHPLRTV